MHSSTDIRHPEELSLLKKPRDPTKKKKKKLDDQSEDEALELEGPLIMPGSGETQIQQRQNMGLTEVRRVVQSPKPLLSHSAVRS